MKRNPTLEEKKLLDRIGLNHAEWLVRKNSTTGMELEHKHTGQRKEIPRSLIK